MSKVAIALHPIKVGGGIIPKGGEVSADQVGQIRLNQLVNRGRAKFPVEGASNNRADTKTGKPDLTLADATKGGGK